MIIGFGTTEVETARQIIMECLKGEPRVIQARHEEDANNHKGNPNPPERYTTFYLNRHEIYPGYTIITFRMLHINRRHPFSPDGWACLNTRWIGTKEEKDQGETEYAIYQEA